jgi:hypothetical protein
MAQLRDALGTRLVIWGLWLVGERRARWLWERQTAYWTRLGDD